MNCLIILVVCLSCFWLVASVSIVNSLTLPFAFGPHSLQSGCLDNAYDKGYCVLNTTTGSILIRFNLDKLSFAGDNVFVAVTVNHTIECFIEPEYQVLYLYGYSANLKSSGKTLASIQSINVTQGIELTTLTTYTTISGDFRGFISAFSKPSTTSVFANYVSANRSQLLELNLVTTGPAIVVHQGILTPPPTGQNYTIGAMYVDSSGLPSKFVFGTTGVIGPSRFSSTTPPAVTFFNSNYPWQLSLLGYLPANSTMYELAPCNGQDYFVVLISSCTPNSCNQFSLAIVDSTLVTTNVIYLTSTSKPGPVITLSCVPQSGLAFVTISNKFFSVDLTTTAVETGYFPTYQDFIWCEARHVSSGLFAYVGATQKSATDSPVVLQLSIDNLGNHIRV